MGVSAIVRWDPLSGVVKSVMAMLEMDNSAAMKVDRLIRGRELRTVFGWSLG